MPRIDKKVSPSVTRKLQSLGYDVAKWDSSQSELEITAEVYSVFKHASKKQNNNIGYPDRIYVNATEKLLIIVEEKSSAKFHETGNIETGAIDGIKWYLSRFADSNLKNALKQYFSNWKIIGIAVSGNLEEMGHLFSAFKLNCIDGEITELTQLTNFVSEDKFLALFNTFDEENSITKVAQSAKKINKLLRIINSQSRPVLLSALMICLFKGKNVRNNFPETYNLMDATQIVNNVVPTVQSVLHNEGVPKEKLEAINMQLDSILAFGHLKDDDLKILKTILNELDQNVIPLYNSFSTKSNYDILGKFYEEFLRFAGVSNVKKGIVLTPRHITTLFTELVPLKSNDKIMDICCGTGAFLIAGMNKIINQLENSNRDDKEEAIEKVKSNQLLGFEIDPTMYICAISNMLFRGDGKSSIYNESCFDTKTFNATKIIQQFKPTIGFINPPYSGKENKDDPTPKEITFLTRMLDNVSRFGVIIAPLSAYFKDNEKRNSILCKHTLRYVINMPSDLFQPNASTHTAIAVFETNRPFDYEKDEVLFYDLRDDGLILQKSKGRTDVYGKWNELKRELLEKLMSPSGNTDDIIFVKTKIKKDDEWTIFAHSKTDYSTLSEKDFIKSITDYLVFSAKKELGIIDADLNEAEMLSILSSYYNGED